jgi:hypothetical protein
MNFLFVHAGWEGSAHDSKVLRDAVKSRGFRAAEGQYWLADAGYSSYDGLCLVPYQKVRYHLKEWAQGSSKPQDAKELFNLRHASARNVVERVFGVFKARFKILSTVHDGYSIRTQKQLVYALTGLHNFINAYGADPAVEWEAVRADLDATREQLGDRADGLGALNVEGRRDQIAAEMWEAYQLYISSGRRGNIEQDAGVNKAEI